MEGRGRGTLMGGVNVNGDGATVNLNIGGGPDDGIPLAQEAPRVRRPRNAGYTNRASIAEARWKKVGKKASSLLFASFPLFGLQWLRGMAQHDVMYFFYEKKASRPPQHCRWAAS